jgi:nickel-dependent lactate racemase
LPDHGEPTRVIAEPGATVPDSEVRHALAGGLGTATRGERIVVLIPDHTRTMPLAPLVRIVLDLLDDAASVTFVIALGTHPPLSEDRISGLVGVSTADRRRLSPRVRFLNHAWADPDTMVDIGRIPAADVRAAAGPRWHPSLGAEDVPVRLNRAVPEADRVIILGPTFPHEVVGFSGGAKYLFPGVSGPEMINVTHWLGALAGVLATIGVQETPVRDLIHRAASFVPVPITLAAGIVEHGGLSGLVVGDPVGAWRVAAGLSAERHVVRHPRPFGRVVSWAPPMYDELWTAAKAMYKLEGVVADGGELVLYAPHLDRVSHVHGAQIAEVGYHVLPYFLEQWDRFRDVPLGILAHSTHLRGAGTFEAGVESARIRVTLASRIGEEACRRLNLGYADPSAIDPEALAAADDPDTLFVPRAGEMLHRLA